jgi:hypothetical protein
MERLVDVFLRNEILTSVPLNSSQHAHQAVKSMEMAHHQHVVPEEKGCIITPPINRCVLLFLNPGLSIPM